MGPRLVDRTLLVFVVAAATACSSNRGDGSSSDTSATNPPGSEGGGGSSSSGGSSSGGGGDGGGDGGGEVGAIDGRKNGSETDIDCGGGKAPKCTEGKSCRVDDDCEVACNYASKCISVRSCKPHLGGDTCGPDEVEVKTGQVESCCRSLPVAGYSDPAHPGKTVYLDKYEVTAGRVRTWIEAMAKEHAGEPNVKAWIQAHRPELWDDAWNTYLPNGWEGPVIVIGRRLLGDPRPEDFGWGVGVGVIVPPPTDEPRRLGVNYQFNAEFYVDIHGSNCGTHPGAWGFPTYYYPPDILARDGQLPRADGVGFDGKRIPAKELLDVKSMNCIPNAMLAAFCAWDGGQLATSEVLDYVTETPASLGNVSGCGSQYDNHTELLDNIFTHTVQTGGTCPAVAFVNATFDAGDALPVPNSPLNDHLYHYPDLGAVDHDKSWTVAAPGRNISDAIRLKPSAEPWMDLHGNLNEAALETRGGRFDGLFALKFRGVGYGSSRSGLNTELMLGESILRLQRPEAKAAYTGGRCMRFR